VSVAGFERLGDELGVGGGGAFLDFGELVRELELSKAFGHGGGRMSEWRLSGRRRGGWRTLESPGPGPRSGSGS
jgi:hypothetical protein